jgi:hypothetical protein
MAYPDGTIEDDDLRMMDREIQRLRAELAEWKQDADELESVLLRSGFARCNISECNCGSWHHRYGLPERMRELEDMLSDAGYPLDNSNGHIIKNAIG